MKMIFKINYLVWLALIWVSAGMSRADVAPGAQCLCHISKPVVNTDGVLVAGTSPNTLAVKTAEGRTLGLPADAQLSALHLAPGLAVHITGLINGPDTQPEVLLQTLAVQKGDHMEVVLKKSYPMQGRCDMCGCRMTITSPEQADSICTMCKCGKKCSECIR